MPPLPTWSWLHLGLQLYIAFSTSPYHLLFAWLFAVRLSSKQHLSLISLSSVLAYSHIPGRTRINSSTGSKPYAIHAASAYACIEKPQRFCSLAMQGSSWTLEHMTQCQALLLPSRMYCSPTEAYQNADIAEQRTGYHALADIMA